ncbi:MAG: tetratricopeptide repeat protein [Chitinophagales bacterium]|nr:tetratricopeptide repeat protein [Chitinophagales bacterium]
MKTLQFLVILFMCNITIAQNIESAKQLIATEKYTEAKQILLQLSTGEETKNAAHYYLGNMYYKKGSADSAKMFYNKIPQGDKDHISLLARGRTALLDNNIPAAKTFFDKAIQVTKSKNADVFYEIADAYISPTSIDPAEAVTKLESAIALSPQNPIYYIRSGDAHFLLDDAGKALSQYENAVAYNDKLAFVWHKIARINSDAHLFDVAVANYKKVVEIDPMNALAWKEYGENLYYNKEYTLVAEAFQKYVELNNDDKEIKLDLCKLYYSYKEYDKAIACSKEIALSDTSNFVAWRIISFANYELKNYPEGYEASKKFWDIPEKKVLPLDYIYSARLASQMKDTTRLMFFFTQALQSDSVSPELYSEYGKALFGLRQWQDAVTTFEEKNTKFGNGALDVFYLGRSYYNMDNYTKADSAFTVFTISQPESPDGYLWRAKSNSNMDTLEFQGLAFPYYEKYVQLAVADVEKNKNNLVDAYIYIAVYHNSKNDNKIACEFIRKALALDPENTFVTDMKKELGC